MSDMEQFRTVFFEECADLLASAESHLSRLGGNSFDPEDIHAIFRAVHSVKGGAGSFGFKTLVEFSHIFETALDTLRNNHNHLTQNFVDLLLRANDVLSILVQNAENNNNVPPESMASIKEQLFELVDYVQKGQIPYGSRETESYKDDKVNSLQAYTIYFEPALDLMRFGNEPYLILRELKKLSFEETYASHANVSRLPSLADYNPENCYLMWAINLETEASEGRLRECFEFVEDDCTLDIRSLSSSNIPQSKSSLPQEGGVSTPEDDPSPLPSIPLTQTTLKEKKQTQRTVPSSSQQQSNSQSQPQGQVDQNVHSIRVELDRIDRLVNTVGEMVIKQAMLLDAAQALKSQAIEGIYDNLTKGLEELTQHTRELQESVMAIRAQPVKAVFSRMPRLIRELAIQLAKEVRIDMSGENTEIDKTVIERLGEPLTHMIRNAVDHGIESPEERLQNGKPAFGTIQLSAEHKSGRIVIQIVDDGRGINREKVLKKAKTQGILPEDVTPTGEEIDQLIFHPGFSTASSVTNISGRGVGMDVVKKSIQALGGRISIQSIEGQGCTFSLLLPLTLAVLDGMIVTVGDECYVIPLIHILETLRPTPQQVSKLVGGLSLLDLREKNIPLIYLHDIFNISKAILNPTEGIVVVLETEGGEQMGLVVDDIVSQQQVVLKSLEANYDPIPGISAATILGNGRVSLILDVNMLRRINH